MSRSMQGPRNKGGRVQRNKGLPVAAKKMLVEKANKITDILGLCKGLAVVHNIGDVQYIVEHSTSLTADPDTKNWLLELTRENMKDLYISSGWGWEDSEKSDELWHKAAQYLIVREKNSRELVGFTHFRFDMDYGCHVLYCYELQVTSSLQSGGLGALLMKLLHRIAFAANMSKVVLTVGRNNKRALKFYFELGYRVDETSLCSLTDPQVPSEEDAGEPPVKSDTYLILSLACRENKENEGKDKRKQNR
ncbi:N-alpha-acetyltransferase 40 isoform X2 [Hyalella azteca]|uniref:N-alpha-acetyltransferase 40 n=1 Tax=Hyalella azteca TaxID=294128 RepID=A0A8B7NMJ8_HYAAZ|nr:N-alpha-acetyltransferase 40 isoform X1 [Hyalella azteca]XP_018014900.1 N-alpha-acetyltransferase 40 isoform X2 [Hyalella azteca]